MQWSSTLSIQSGQWFSRGVQVRNADNSNVTQTLAGNVGRYPTVTLWDHRFTKRFKVTERHSLEGYLEVFNSMNRLKTGRSSPAATVKGPDAHNQDNAPAMPSIRVRASASSSPTVFKKFG
jgi:hypothetical protein